MHTFFGRTFFNVFKLDEAATTFEIYDEFVGPCTSFLLNLLSELNKKPFVHIFIWAISSVNSNTVFFLLVRFLLLLSGHQKMLHTIVREPNEKKYFFFVFFCSHFAWIFNKINDSNFLDRLRLEKKKSFHIFSWDERARERTNTLRHIKTRCSQMSTSNEYSHFFSSQSNSLRFTNCRFMYLSRINILCQVTTRAESQKWNMKPKRKKPRWILHKCHHLMLKKSSTNAPMF